MLLEDMTCAHLRNSDLPLDDVGAALHHCKFGDKLLNLLLKLLAANFERRLKLPVLSSRLVGPLPQHLAKALGPLVGFARHLKHFILYMEPTHGKPRED